MAFQFVPDATQGATPGPVQPSTGGFKFSPDVAQTNPIANKLNTSTPEQKQGIWEAMQHFGEQALGGLKNIGIGATKSALDFGQSLAPKNPDGTIKDEAPYLTKLGMKIPDVTPHGGAQKTGYYGATAASILGPVGAAGLEAGAGDVIKGVVSKLAKPQSVEDLVGKITQGSKAQIKKATAALSLIDTTAVKTFKDLKDVAQAQIKNFAKGQDTVLSQPHIDVPKPLKAYNITKTVKGQSVTKNFVGDSLSQMKDFYQKSNDLEGQAYVKSIEKKISSGGLTPKDVNDIARQYNTDFATKAFNPKTGEPLGTTNKVMMENTRTGLKDSVDKHVDDPAYKALDTHMSNLYTLRDTASQLESAVQKLENKLPIQNPLMKAGQAVGKAVGTAIDVASLGSLKGIVTKFLPKEAAVSTLDVGKIQANLAKNLKKVNKLIDTGSQQEILDYIKSLGG